MAWTALDAERLGRELKAARVLKGVGFGEACDLLSISGPVLGDMENGRIHGTRFETVARYAAFVGHPLADSLPTAEPATEGAE